ncbi:hypothetical protein DKX38_012304 [Salix brachista]|uniref:Uncharacterized protein n=1 Tax=Salix brachista TaxID=2182728 RepID=A0A5N5LNJ7_9ROSI|nr:hypothetical protein DKX38_012304 [Salix brachista]
MDSKNGTPKEKGNASLPPRRGQIKDKIGTDLKTFIAGLAGKRSDEDGGNKTVTYLPQSGFCSDVQEEDSTVLPLHHLVAYCGNDDRYRPPLLFPSLQKNPSSCQSWNAST